MSDTYSVCPSCKGLNKVKVENISTKSPVCGACGATLPFDGSHQNVDEVTLRTLMNKSPQPVIVDFWASWCGPCQSFGPTFAETAKGFLGKFVFVKLNTEANPNIGTEMGIRGIPSIVCVKSGKELGRQSGAMPKPMLEKWIHSLA